MEALIFVIIDLFDVHACHLLDLLDELLLHLLQLVTIDELLLHDLLSSSCSMLLLRLRIVQSRHHLSHHLLLLLPRSLLIDLGRASAATATSTGSKKLLWVHSGHVIGEVGVLETHVAV